jgi:hypothetical protein
MGELRLEGQQSDGVDMHSNEALKLSARFARRSLTPGRYAARRSHRERRF